MHCSVYREIETFSPHSKIQLDLNDLCVCGVGGEAGTEVRNGKKEIPMGTIFAAPSFFTMVRKMGNSIGSCVRVPETTPQV